MIYVFSLINMMNVSSIAHNTGLSHKEHVCFSINSRPQHDSYKVKPKLIQQVYKIDHSNFRENKLIFIAPSNLFSEN